MACSSGNSSGLTLNMSSSGSEADLMLIMDQKKRKRMESNRESARKSRKRKQKLMDDLTTQLAQLRVTNGELHTRISFTSQNLLRVEQENAVLRAQMAELGQRLEAVDEMLIYMNMTGAAGGDYYGGMDEYDQPNYGEIISPLMMNNMMMGGYVMMNNQPIIAAASDVFEY